MIFFVVLQGYQWHLLPKLGVWWSKFYESEVHCLRSGGQIKSALKSASVLITQEKLCNIIPIKAKMCTLILIMFINRESFGQQVEWNILGPLWHPVPSWHLFDYSIYTTYPIKCFLGPLHKRGILRKESKTRVSIYTRTWKSIGVISTVEVNSGCQDLWDSGT